MKKTMQTLEGQLSAFAGCTTDEDVCTAFLRAVLPPHCAPQLVALLRDRRDLAHLALLGLSLADAEERADAAPAVLGALLSCEDEEAVPRLTRAATRLLPGLGAAEARVLETVAPAADEEAWAEQEVAVRALGRVLGLLEALSTAGNEAARVGLSREVLPALLRVAADSEGAAPLRRSMILRRLHSFYASPREQSVAELWATLERAAPDDALELLCRVAGHLRQGGRLARLAVLPAFWQFLFRRMEECGLYKNVPLARAKQAAYAVREAVSALAADKALAVAAEPWMQWRPIAAASAAAVRDWETYLSLFELLEQYALHLIEPAWPSFEALALADTIPPLWLQLLLRRTLLHDSVHVTRMALIFLFQSRPEARRWLTPDFFCGPLLSR